MRQIIWKNERGVALPMAVLLLLVLTSLMLAFVSLAQTEPMIAKNHLLATQARAQAEAGFERAVWALSQGAIANDQGVPIPANAIDPASLPNNGTVAPNPYNGSAYLISGATGGFEVTVTRTATSERQVAAIGYAPGNTGPARSRRRIEATVWRLPDQLVDAPCALCVNGDVAVGGNSSIDSTLPQTDSHCGGNKYGVLSAGLIVESGSASIKGQDGNNIPNQATDYKQNTAVTDPTAFDKMTLGANTFKNLRKLAMLNGTYFGPGYPNGGTTAVSSPSWTGSVTFNASHQLGNGIVFIDTVSGHDIPTVISQQNTSDFASVTIDGNPFIGDQPDPNQFKGWLVVNGSLAISGNMKINGLVYVVNDLTYNGTGTGEINGLAVSQNVRDVTATAISTAFDPDSTTTGNSRVKFNCANLRTPFLPQGFSVKPGTYREVTD
jgi:Tfp pilus assembly protein PilX